MRSNTREAKIRSDRGNRARGKDSVAMHTRRNSGRGLKGLAIAAVVLPLLAGGCSSVPNAANPAHWYRSTADWISGDDKAKDAAAKDADAAKKKGSEPSTAVTDKDKPPPGADGSFPKLSSVPERPKREVPQGLGADPNRPRYAAAVPRQEDVEGPSRAAPAAPKETMQPAPPPMPAKPVEAAPTSSKASPQTVAAAPAAASSPGKAPPEPPAPPGNAGTTVEQTYRAKMAERYKPDSGNAQIAAMPPASADLGTVVVSSQGVESGSGQVVAAMTAPAAASGTVFHGTNNAGVNARSVKVATVLFGNGSSQLSPRARQVLDQVAGLYKSKGGVVRVVGHASSRTRTMDPIKHKMVNFNVSVARADAVARHLLQRGVTKDRIAVGAVSDADPQFYEVMPTGEAGNRRAEVYIDF